MVKGKGVPAILALLLVLSLLAAIAGCGEETEGVLKIGVSAPLSGPAAPVGLGMPRGVEIAAAEINDAGGISVGGTKYTLQVVSMDDKATSEGGVTVATSFVADGIKFVVGPIISAAYLGAAPTYNNNKVLVQHMCTAFSATTADKPFGFRCFAGGVGVLGGFYTWLKQSNFMPGVKNVAFINPDDASGQELEPSMRAAATDNGFNIVLSEFVPRGITDAASLVLKVLAKNPDLIDMGVITTGDGSVILKELYAQGYKGKIMFSSAQPPETLVKLCGASVVEGVLTWAGDPESSLVTAGYKDFYNKYVSKYNEAPMMIAAGSAYDAVYTLKAAILKAGTLDTTTVRDTMADMHWDTKLYGPTTWGGQDLFGIKRQILTPVLFAHFQGGKLVTVGITQSKFYAPAN